MKTRFIFSILSLLLFASNAKSQHCAFEFTRICVISIDDSVLEQAVKVELLLVDSLGNELLSTRQKKKQYCVDDTPQKITSSRFFFFGKTGSLRVGYYYYALSRMETVNSKDFFLAMLDKDVEIFFKTKGSLYLQLRRMKGDTSGILAQVEISLSDFQIGCTSARHWHHEDKMNAIKVRIK